MEFEVPRDQIFSLLYLCTEAHKFEGDYDSTDADACVDILKQFSSSMCLCMPRVLAESMGLKKGYDKEWRQENGKYIFIELEMPGVSFNKTKKIYELEGHRYTFYDLHIEWDLYNGSKVPQPCESVLRLLKHISLWQGVLTSDVPKPRKVPRICRAILQLLRHYSEQQSIPFSDVWGSLEAPKVEYQPVSYVTVLNHRELSREMINDGAVDISGKFDVLQDRKKTWWYADDLCIWEYDTNSSIIRGLLSTVLCITSWWSKECPETKLRHIDLNNVGNTFNLVKMQVRRAPWMIKPQGDKYARDAYAGNTIGKELPTLSLLGDSKRQILLQFT